MGNVIAGMFPLLRLRQRFSENVSSLLGSVYVVGLEASFQVPFMQPRNVNLMGSSHMPHGFTFAGFNNPNGSLIILFKRHLDPTIQHQFP